jgi:hypothetical protein
MITPVLPSRFAQQVVEALSIGGRWEIVQKRVGAQGIIPTTQQLAVLFDVAFFASTGKEEGHQARFSLALLNPTRWGVHRFAKPEPLTVESLAKLSAACYEDATALSVYMTDAGWAIWGIGVNVPPAQRGSRVLVPEHYLTLTVREAGALALRSYHEIIFQYAGGIGLIPASSTAVDDLIAEVLSLGDETLQPHHLSAICRAMRAHARGGALLVVPTTAPASISFRYEIFQERTPRLLFTDGHIAGETEEKYVVAPLAEAVMNENAHAKREAEDRKSDPASTDHFVLHTFEWTDLQAAQIGRLTAVDGIAAVTHEMAVLGFGGKIPVPDDFPTRQVLHLDPRTGVRTSLTAKELFSGMRHTSAAAACLAHGPGAMALVQSQDGALTIMIARANSELYVISPIDRLLPLFDR